MMRRSRNRASILGFMIAALLVVGCGGPDRPCLHSHEQLMPFFTGKTMMMIPETICDQYGPLPTTTKQTKGY